jgi:hypothetical protein
MEALLCLLDSLFIPYFFPICWAGEWLVVWIGEDLDLLVSLRRVRRRNLTVGCKGTVMVQSSVKNLESERGMI